MTEQLPLLVAEAVDETTYVCGARFYYRVYDEYDYDTCGEKAIACSLEAESGRCGQHLDEFIYLEQWGFVPKPKFIFEWKDAAKGHEPNDCNQFELYVQAIQQLASSNG